MTNRTAKLLLAAALAAVSVAAHAQLYRWTDQNGRVRYGDTPPPGVNATAMSGPSVAATTPALPLPQDATLAECDASRDRLSTLQGSRSGQYMNDAAIAKGIAKEQGFQRSNCR